MFVRGRAATNDCPDASLLTYHDVMTRTIDRVGPRAKRLRAADEDGAAKDHVRHFEVAIS